MNNDAPILAALDGFHQCLEQGIGLNARRSAVSHLRCQR